jgi:hypothetical protein
MYSFIGFDKFNQYLHLLVETEFGVVDVCWVGSHKPVSCLTLT